MDQAEFYLSGFHLFIKLDGEPYYMSVFPAMRPNFPTGIKPSGGYEVYCVHPQYCSCFYVEQDENCKWFCEIKPPSIRNAPVRFIGLQIVGALQVKIQPFTF